MGNQLNLYLQKILTINETKNKINIKNISFLNGRYQAIYFYEKHFVNVYRVLDHSTNEYKNLKLIHILNDKEIKENINKDKNKYISLTNHTNPGLVKIEAFYLDEFVNNKNYANLIIIEEPVDYITIKDFLLIFIQEFKTENLQIFKMVKINLI